MHRRLIYFAGRCDHILPPLYGRWHGEAVTEGLIRRHKNARFRLVGRCALTPPRKRADAVASAQVVI